MNKKTNYVALWFLFFVFCTASFAVMLMLQLTKTIHVSWFLVFAPLIAEVMLPLLVCAVAAVLEALDKGEINDE